MPREKWSSAYLDRDDWVFNPSTPIDVELVREKSGSIPAIPLSDEARSSLFQHLLKKRGYETKPIYGPGPEWFSVHKPDHTGAMVHSQNMAPSTQRAMTRYQLEECFPKLTETASMQDRPFKDRIKDLVKRGYFCNAPATIAAADSPVFAIRNPRSDSHLPVATMDAYTHRRMDDEEYERLFPDLNQAYSFETLLSQYKEQAPEDYKYLWKMGDKDHGYPTFEQWEFEQWADPGGFTDDRSVHDIKLYVNLGNGWVFTGFVYSYWTKEYKFINNLDEPLTISQRLLRHEEKKQRGE